MAANPLSNVVFNAREELLTTDLNRAEKMLSAGVQNILRDDGRDDDARTAGGVFQVGAGSPLTGGTKVSTLTFSAGFTSTVSEGQGFFNDGLATGLSDDTSDYPVVRWAATNITFAAPDATNPRIDLIICTPATVTTDNQTRNILLDPVARTVAQQSVPKKSNPVGTVSVVAGTAAASPVAPALPGGTVAIMEVLVPAAAATAATFTPARRMPRRAVFPVSTYNGIIQDCHLFWSSVDETTTASSIVSFHGTASINKVVINGEVLAFGPLSTSNATIIQDAGGNSPFAAAAPATSDRPYYIYVAGGQASPQASIGASNVLYPVVVVESLVAPLPDGRPSANLTTPRGTTTNAILIGVGWTVQNSTRRKGVFMAGDWVHPLSGQQTNGLAGTQFAAFNDTISRATGAGVTNHLLNTAPSLNVAPAAKVFAQYENTVDGANLELGRNIGGTVHAGTQILALDTGVSSPSTFIQALSGAGASVDAGPDPETATGTLRLFSVGYQLNLRRYGL